MALTISVCSSCEWAAALEVWYIRVIRAAAHSHEEHEAIFKAIKARDAQAAVELLDAHLCHVEEALNFKQHNALTA